MMMDRKRLVCWMMTMMAISTLCAGCQSQRADSTATSDLGAQHAGHGATYVSQLGNFTCPKPSGTKVLESSTLDSDEVSFNDAGALRLRVISFSLARLFTTAPRGNDEWQEALQSIFYQHVMAKQFLRRSIKASVISEEYIDSPVGKAYFASVDVPPTNERPSAAANASPPPEDNLRPGAVYGVLLFPARNYLYVLMMQSPSNDTSTAPEQQSNLLREQLKKTAAAMSFK